MFVVHQFLTYLVYEFNSNHKEYLHRKHTKCNRVINDFSSNDMLNALC